MVMSKACQRSCSLVARYHVQAGEMRTSSCGRHLTRSIDMVIRLENEAGRTIRSAIVTPARAGGENGG